VQKAGSKSVPKGFIKAQSSGLAQIDQALSEMDEATQHNAVLVQKAAAAIDLAGEAAALRDATAIFRISL
jgi:methyl-accepting chemotaxis protein I, serine sensor receptor